MEQKDREMLSLSVELFSNKLDRVEELLERVVVLLQHQYASQQESVELLDKIKDAQS